MTFHLGVYTIGYTEAPFSELSTHGSSIQDMIYEELANEPGFLLSSNTLPENPTFSGFHHESGYCIQTLSVWRDLNSVFHYVYKAHGHRRAMRELPEHYEKLPNGRAVYDVLWWLDGDPETLDEAILSSEAHRKMEYLLQEGPSAYAFNLKHPYDEQGNIADFRALRDQHW